MAEQELREEIDSVRRKLAWTEEAVNLLKDAHYHLNAGENLAHAYRLREFIVCVEDKKLGLETELKELKERK